MTREGQLRLRAKRDAQGQCLSCGADARVTKTLCGPCSSLMKERNARTRAYRIVNGLCVHCRVASINPSTGGTQSCDYHRAALSTASGPPKARWTATSCLRCGKPDRGPLTLCAACSEFKNAKQREKWKAKVAAMPPKPKTQATRDSSEYGIWINMKNRCFNPKADNYKYYGGRGIAVCEDWRCSFSAFYAHIGPRPSKNHTVDRIDTLRGYEPGNVRWAAPEVQQNNRRDCRFLEAFGKTQTIAQWARECGIPYGYIRDRLELGWSAADAIATPVRKMAPRT